MARCEVSGTEVVQGRGRARRTCSAACRQKAHRRRQAEQVAELRAAATRPALTPVPPIALDDSAAGRIRAAGAQLADAVEHAARCAAANWAAPGIAPDAMVGRLGEVQHHVDKVMAAILASVPEMSRNEPVAAVPVPDGREAPAADSELSRDEPAVERSPTARRKRLTQKAARVIADRARLVRDERHEGWLLRDDETSTVLGRIEPSYGGTSSSGRNGWVYRVDGSFARNGPYKTRDKAAVPCALSWMRLVTAAPRR
jgi:hypothetical protein